MEAVMSKAPPVPPENLSPKGTGDSADPGKTGVHGTDPSTANFDKQGQQGNSKINTTHQGYQQDR
jgi:hypothetical protein